MTEKLSGVAICGSHPFTVSLAPFNDPSWYIYSCSPHNVEKRTLPRWDEWFEVHKPVRHQTRGDYYVETIKSFKHVWMRAEETMHEFPGAKLYPERDLRGVGKYIDLPNGQKWLVDITEFGKFSYFHFTSSIAYMMAMAIDKCEKENIPSIGLWGIMQASPTEYQYQRPGIQYFISEAFKRGIKVVAPDISGLFQPPSDDW